MESKLRHTFRLKNWSLFERVWMAVFLSSGTVVALVTKDSLLNYVILVTGIFSVVLAAKGNIWTYAFGLFNSLGYGYVSYINGLYGDMALNLFFFVPTAVLGFVMWQKHLARDTVKMRGLTLRQWSYVLAICAVGSVGLGYGLSTIKTQNTAYLDACSTLLSIVATFLMMWRYKEQWLLYITLNLVTIWMWSIRLLDGSSDGAIMMVMWSAYLVNSVYGYGVWKKGAALHQEENA